MKKKHCNIPVFVPHIGCPHDCVFCNQRQITGAQSRITAADVKRIIEEQLEYIDRSNTYVEVAFFGGSFTGIDFELQTELMSAAYEYIKAGKVDSQRCSTRPDCIDEDILENVKKYGMKNIEVCVQTTDDEVLAKSGRGHGRAEVFAASELIKKHGFPLGLQMMLGLPGDTWDKSIKTAEDIISIAPDFVRIYPTLVVENTALYDMYKSGEYTPLTIEDAAKLSAQLLELMESKGIDVIRIGLQTTDNINEATVAGPYHSAMGELAASLVYRNRIEDYIRKNSLTGRVEYAVPKADISKAVGQKRCNIEYFREKYNVDLKIIGKY